MDLQLAALERFYYSLMEEQYEHRYHWQSEELEDDGDLMAYTSEEVI